VGGSNKECISVFYAINFTTKGSMSIFFSYKNVVTPEIYLGGYARDTMGGNTVMMHSRGRNVSPGATPSVYILGVPYGGSGAVHNFKKGLMEIRKFFYELKCRGEVVICDIGDIDIKISKGKKDYTRVVEHVRDIVHECVSQGGRIIIVGASSLYGYAQSMGCGGEDTTLCVISPNLPLGKYNELNAVTSDNFLSHLILAEESVIGHYIHIGYQRYYVSMEELALIEDMGFEAYPLGYFRRDIHRVEPLVRDADNIVVSLNAIKHGDFPCSGTPHPNGFTAEAICQIVYYAGLGGRTRVLGIYDYHPERDVWGVGAKLIAQIMWHFVDGVMNSIVEVPSDSDDKFIKYLVPVPDSSTIMTFYKSKMTDRWFFQIPNTRKHVAVSLNDYMSVFRGEIPRRISVFLNKNKNR